MNKSLIKNGKYFVPPPNLGDDFKQLFKRMTAAGVGLPVDSDGFPTGEWTPERLAAAISEIDGNPAGVELRTVQHWFEENDKGIGIDNIRWLARVFGCDDPDLTREWQMALSASNRTLAAKRKSARLTGGNLRTAASGIPSNGYVASVVPSAAKNGGWRLGLAKGTEALFETQSALGLPIVVFVAAVALGLISFTLNIHSVAIATEAFPVRQIGFLWAPNWTIVFLLVLPMYFAFLIDLLKRWKSQLRHQLGAVRGSARATASWDANIASTSYSYWAVLFVTVVIASGYNWTATHLWPLMTGDSGGWPIDWGRIAIVRPDVISVPSAVTFTALVFLYNAVCSYLFFAGLILLNVIVYDYAEVVRSPGLGSTENASNVENVGVALRKGVFRCVSLGLTITILMKLQSVFLQSSSYSIIYWIIADVGLHSSSSALGSDSEHYQRSAPGFYYSFFCMLAIAGTFIHSELRIGRVISQLSSIQSNRSRSYATSLMPATVVLLVCSYLLLGTVPGSTFLVVISIVLMTFLICSPANYRGPPQKDM